MRKRNEEGLPHWGALPLIVVTAAGLGLRLWNLGAQSLWFDEAQTLSVATLPLERIAQQAYRPPLYHYMLHFWAMIANHGEFWLRLPSALLGAATPVAAYLVAAKLYGRKIGLLAAALAAISPTLIWYSQELRMYSLLALEYLILLYTFARLIVAGDQGRKWFALLFLAEVISLYTHYFAIPFLFWFVALSMGVLIARREWRSLRSWLAVQVAAAVAFAPWLAVILQGRGGASDYVNAEVLPVVTSVPGLKEFVSQSWLFYATGAITDNRLLRTLSIVAAICLAGALATLLPGAARAMWRVVRNKDGDTHGGDASWSDACVVALAGGPAVTALAIYQLRPGVVHPRHMMMVAGPFVILVARAASQMFGGRLPESSHLAKWAAASVRRVAGAATLVAFLATFLVGLWLAYQGSGPKRPDVRGLARTVQNLVGGEGVVLLPYQDYAFDYYYHDSGAVYRLETTVGDEGLAGWLIPRIQNARRVVLLNWVQAFVDPRGFLPWLLQVNGRLTQRFWQAERWVSVYDLFGPLSMPVFSALGVRMDPLRLRGVYFPASVPADQAVAVALQWEVVNRAAVDYSATVRVLDADGQVIAADDRVLLGEHSSVGTSKWPPQTKANNYYLLHLPPGTPPATYTLVVSAYHGSDGLDVLNAQGAAVGRFQMLGTFKVTPAAAYPDTFPDSVPMIRVGRLAAPGLALEGYSVDPPEAQPGESVGVTLYWKALTAPLPAYQPELRVVSAAGTLVGRQQSAPAYGEYPCDRWRRGELVIDRRHVRIAPSAEAGPATIALSVEGGGAIPLGGIALRAADRQFTLPAIQHPMDVGLGDIARLKGYSVNSEAASPGAPLQLTLYWQATNDDPVSVSYSVFTHLLDSNNRVIAQHDGTPGGGNLPTTTWIKDQIVVDSHELVFKNDQYEGEAVLEVGMYDPKTFQRLATSDGDDKVILPIKITVSR